MIEITVASIAAAGLVVQAYVHRHNRNAHGSVETKLDYLVARVDNLSGRVDHLATRLDHMEDARP